MSTPRRTGLRLTLTAFALTTLALSACAPAPLTNHTTRTTSTSAPNPITLFHPAADYHPHEPGTTLHYRAPNGDSRASLHTLPPTTFAGDTIQRHHLHGGVLDELRYLQSTPSGVLLHRIDTPQRITSFDPPILDLPAAGRLEPTLRWGGETTVREYRPHPDGPILEREYHLTYLTTVTDMRYVRITNQRHLSFLIASEHYAHHDSHTSRSDSQRWYAPYVGDILTPHGLTLELAQLD